MNTSNQPKELLGLPITASSVLGGVLGIIVGMAMVTLIGETTVLATFKVGAIAGVTALVVSVVMIWLIPTGEGFSERYEPISEFGIGIAIGALVTLIVINGAIAVGFVSAYIIGSVVLGVIGYLSLGFLHIGIDAMSMIAIGSIIALRWFVVALVIKLTMLFCLDFV